MSPRSYHSILGLIVLIGLVRIVATYRVFCETFDEPAHIASGIEWLDRGTYMEDPTHPPLARVMATLWPYLSGIRSIKGDSFLVDGNHVLYANDRYLTNLSRARAGILPFFIAATLIVAAWARRLWGDAGGLAAALLFSNEPNILAHSGLTTTDMAAAAMTVAAAFAFWRWLDDDRRPRADGRPRASGLGPRTVWLGVAIGLALLAKFSTLLFVPVACVAIAACIRRQPKFFALAIAAVVAFLIVFVGYRFNLYEFWHGIVSVRVHVHDGHPSYLFGEFRRFGWWYYFPLAIGLKTTFGFLILFFMGAAFVRNREQAAPLAAGFLILLVSLPVTINIGVRHILPVYPFFAIVAAGAVAAHRRIGMALCAVAVIASLAAHPDYLPYFNALAGPRPDRIFVDSNLDWGQDLLRLKAELRRRDIRSVALAYAGNAEPDRHNFPRITKLDALRYTPGWAAISEVIVHSDGPQYRWLERFNPVMEVGKSIRLYYLPQLSELMSGVPIKTTSSRTRLLIPIWFEGTFHGANAWTCNLTIQNEGGLQIPLRSVADVVVPAESTITNPNFGVGDARDGAILYADRDDAAQLHFALTVRSATGQTVAMPVVREHDLLATEARFASVPISDVDAATLRIYDITGKATMATVHLIDGSGSTAATIQLRQRDAKPAFPASAAVALNRLFPGRSLASARIVVDPPSTSYWACVTVSERASNQAYVILPD